MEVIIFFVDFVNLSLDESVADEIIFIKKIVIIKGKLNP